MISCLAVNSHDLLKLPVITPFEIRGMNVPKYCFYINHGIDFIVSEHKLSIEIPVLFAPRRT